MFYWGMTQTLANRNRIDKHSCAATMLLLYLVQSRKKLFEQSRHIVSMVWSIHHLLCYVSFPVGRSSLPLVWLGSRTLFCYTKSPADSLSFSSIPLSSLVEVFPFSSTPLSSLAEVFPSSSILLSSLAKVFPFSFIPLRSLAKVFSFSSIPLCSKADAAPVMPSSQKFSDSSWTVASPAPKAELLLTKWSALKSCSLV